MRFLIIALFINILAIALSGCKKDSCSFYGNDQNSYTQRDVNAVVIGAPDPKDWTADLHWNACENDLFNFPDTFTYQGLSNLPVTNMIVFPNPFLAVLDFMATDSGPAIEKFVVVDANMNIKWKATWRSNGNMHFSLNLPGLDSTVNYRMYYRFYGNNQTVISQGHGDLRTIN